MKKRYLLIAAVLAIVMSLTACGTELPSVYVQTVAQIMGYSTMGEFNACAGVVVAQNELRIERDESRKVAQLLVEAGQEVAAGDVLFVYDTEELQLSINKLKLEIEQMKNTVKDLTSQISELEKEKKKAPESDKLSYTVRIQGLETDKDENEYYIKVKQQELATMQETAKDGKVTAPIDGKIKSINEDGGYDDMTGQPLPYMTLIQSGAYRVKGKVNELNRADFTVGQTVLVRSRVDETLTWTGVLTQMETTPEDSGSNNYFYNGVSDEMTSTSSYAFYVELDTTEGLILGQHVYIEPDRGQTLDMAGLWLYADYVQGTAENGYYVWAADGNGRIEKRTVKLGQYDELQYAWQIVNGLSATDRVAYPSASMQEGAPVTDTQPDPAEEIDPAFSDEPAALPEGDDIWPNDFDEAENEDFNAESGAEFTDEESAGQ